MMCQSRSWSCIPLLSGRNIQDCDCLQPQNIKMRLIVPRTGCVINLSPFSFTKCLKQLRQERECLGKLVHQVLCLDRACFGRVGQVRGHSIRNPKSSNLVRVVNNCEPDWQGHAEVALVAVLPELAIVARLHIFFEIPLLLLWNPQKQIQFPFPYVKSSHVEPPCMSNESCHT